MTERTAPALAPACGDCINPDETVCAARARATVVQIIERSFPMRVHKTALHTCSSRTAGDRRTQFLDPVWKRLAPNPSSLETRPVGRGEMTRRVSTIHNVL